MKTFTPKTASMTKAEIWNFFYDKQGKKFACYALPNEGDDGDGFELVSKPAYTANEIPDKLCQMFVDAEHCLRDEYVDEAEEDMVDARDDIVRDFHRRILKALKRK